MVRVSRVAPLRRIPRQPVVNNGNASNVSQEIFFLQKLILYAAETVGLYIGVAPAPSVNVTGIILALVSLKVLWYLH